MGGGAMLSNSYGLSPMGLSYIC